MADAETVGRGLRWALWAGEDTAVNGSFLLEHWEVALPARQLAVENGILAADVSFLTAALHALSSSCSLLDIGQATPLLTIGYSAFPVAAAKSVEGNMSPSITFFRVISNFLFKRFSGEL